MGLLFEISTHKMRVVTVCFKRFIQRDLVQRLDGDASTLPSINMFKDRVWQLWCGSTTKSELTIMTVIAIQSFVLSLVPFVPAI
jgi:hypothetical protein